MYKTLLILKYLRKRRIAWVSLLAVTLCTTMVIVVMSVMGGWLGMFRESQRGLIGDVIVTRRSWSGFPHYEKVVEALEKMPQVKAAVPAIQSFGLINITNQIRSGVQVYGYPIEKIGQVNRFPQSLYRQWQSEVNAAADKDKAAVGAAAEKAVSFKPPLPAEDYQMLVPNSKTDVSKWPGMIVGDGVVGIRKAADGTITPPSSLLEHWAKLTVMGMDDDSGAPDVNAKSERSFWIVDNSRTKFYQQDENTVYVPFDVLQKDLRMDADSYTDAVTGLQVAIPARTSNIQIALKPGVDSAAAVIAIEATVKNVLSANGYDADLHGIDVLTWEQLQADFINAIEHEIVLTTLLFAIISIVAVFLIFCIFYMIVVEKTRDVGIIKSVGATSGGVMSIFLGYGLAIGMLGGGLGLLLSYLIVHYINEIHSWMGRALHIEVWNAKTYMFDTIPNQLDPKKVSIIVAAAVVSSVLGSLYPAIRAARMNPVEALRWE